MAMEFFGMGVRLGVLLGLLPFLFALARGQSRLSLFVTVLLGAAGGGVIGIVLAPLLFGSGFTVSLTQIVPADVMHFLCGILLAVGIGLIVGDYFVGREPAGERRIFGKSRPSYWSQ